MIDFDRQALADPGLQRGDQRRKRGFRVRDNGEVRLESLVDLQFGNVDVNQRAAFEQVGTVGKGGMLV